MKKVLILHGPNMNLLGSREPDVYGRTTLEEINQRLNQIGRELSFEVRAEQSNHEGELIEHLHSARIWAKGVIFNPAGYTHSSVALRDAIVGIKLPVIEVHLSNIYAREDFRQRSLIAPVSAGSISGFGWYSYVLGLYALKNILQSQKSPYGESELTG